MGEPMMPDAKVQSDALKRHIRIGTMTWPTVDNDLAWRLRYAQDSISNKDKFYLASLMDAYSELIRCKREKREMVCRTIRKES